LHSEIVSNHLPSTASGNKKGEDYEKKTHQQASRYDQIRHLPKPHGQSVAEPRLKSRLPSFQCTTLIAKVVLQTASDTNKSIPKLCCRE